MGQRTVAVVGIGFAPKKSKPTQKRKRSPEAAPVSRPERPVEPPIESINPPVAEAPADTTDPMVLAGGVGKQVTRAVVGVNFAPQKSSQE